MIKSTVFRITRGVAPGNGLELVVALLGASFSAVMTAGLNG